MTFRNVILASVSSAAVFFAAAPSAPAADGSIVYVCGANLCAVGPQGGTPTPVTTDGTDADPYRAPSVSADGRTIAALRGNTIVKGETGKPLAPVAQSAKSTTSLTMSPDGQRLMYGGLETKTFQPPMDCRWVNDTYDCSVVPQQVTVEGWFRSVPDQGLEGRGTAPLFLGAGLASVRLNTNGQFFICTLDAAAPDKDCGAMIVATKPLDLVEPAASASGNLIAARSGVITSDGRQDEGTLDVFRPDGSLIGTVARGVAGRAAFSPDETMLAYPGNDGGIWVVPVAGGTPVRVVEQGSAPTWGAALAAATTDPAALSGGRPALSWARAIPSVRRTALRSRRFTVRVNCSAACSLKASVKSGGRTIASGRGRRASAGRVTIRLRPTRAGRRMRLEKGRRVTVAVSGRAGGERVVLSTRARLR